MIKDPIGDRMKGQYEDRTRYMLPRRTYTIIRLDGVAFHTFTKNFTRPFDSYFTNAMMCALENLSRMAQGFKFGYMQSDEISILLTDFAEPATAAWFDGNLQKITSVSASIATAAFNRYFDPPLSTSAHFDARAFVIPDPVEVENYFIWRQKDAMRNSLNAYAQSKFGHKALLNKSQADVHEMLHEIDANWTTGVAQGDKNGYIISRSVSDAAPVFLKNREFLRSVIPIQWAEDKA